MALLLTNNSSASTVAAGGVVNLGSAVHGCGKEIRLNGNAITLTKAGYYEISISATISDTGTGEVTISMLKDGVAVPGAFATSQVSTAGEAVNLSFPWIVRKCNCCEATNLTFISDSAATVDNVIVEVKKL